MTNIPFDFDKASLEFVKSLRPVLRPNTCRIYESSLRAFHHFLKQEKISLLQLNRTYIERWMTQLYEKKLNPITRSIRLMYVRTFLFWLEDQSLIALQTSRLIRNSDLPKVPTRLPRPLPRELDIEIQRRLSHSSSRHHRALVLMRKTGIRIGELSNLSFDCLRENSNGLYFLKVPLGKLHNERMVPLDLSGVNLVRELQATTLLHSNNKMPQHLLWGRKTDRISADMLRHTFREITRDLTAQSKDPINPHRFRHSYATELLDAGMSLQSIMWLLGHRSVSMTLKYAAVTQITVLSEYQRANEKMKIRYHLPRLDAPILDFSDPILALVNIGKYLQSSVDPKDPKKVRMLNLILRRIQLLQEDIPQLYSFISQSGQALNL